ncbi:tetratricopeptide repeat protein [Vampirovibrio chlorellavorus]|uniref:tetratricopeptide repeat protein n=1 Tax=Vampirovibrio chlorellavorus TaxID=758823 RepID=UPI0026F3372C|nr:tetratricopeptide repeat protein [Vampirovibrio chlorellavorus]
MFQNRSGFLSAWMAVLILGFAGFRPSDGLAATPARKLNTPSKAAPVRGRTTTRPTTVNRAVGVKPAAQKPGSSAGAVKATPSPNAFLAYFNTGKQAYEAGRLAEAETSLKKSLSLAIQTMSPQHQNIGILYNLLGLIQMKRHNYPGATASFKQAVAIYSLRPEGPERNGFLLNEYLRMGLMAMYDGRFTEGHQYYQAALPLAEGLGDPEQVQGIQQVLSEIARIDHGPDYLSEASQTVTRWSHPEQPIQIYIADGADFADWRPGNKAIVQEAFGEWQQAMGTRLRFVFVEDPQAADIQVSWMNVPSANSAEGRFSSQSELRHGICETQAMNQFLIKDNIRLALHNTDGSAFSANVLYNTLLHEIAHAIGLISGHSRNPADVLYPNIRYEDGRRKHLSARDIATAHKLYALPPAVTNPAGIHLVRFNQFAETRLKASTAYNGGDYPSAFSQFQQALSIYPQDADSRFWMAMSAWKLKQYDVALPQFMAAANQSGQFQGEALRMAGSSLILSAQQDDQSGNHSQAEGQYQQARALLTQGLPRISMKPEQATAIQDTLSWLNQRLAMRSNIQWASTDVRNTASETSGKKKKRGWFSALFDPGTGTNQVPINMMMPSRMMGY